MPASFYDTDIAPYSSRFFSQVSADSRLSDAQRGRIQGTLLNGMQDITATRAKMQEERDQGRAAQLSYARGTDELEEARRSRARVQQQQAKIGGLKEQAFGVLTADADPEVKHQALGALAVANMDVLAANDGARTVMGIAMNSLPKSETKGGLTPSSFARYATKVPREIMATEDPELIGRAFGEIQKEEDAIEEAKKMSATQKAELAKMPLKYDSKWANPKTGEIEDDRWLDPESTQRATAIVHALGTPEELKRFVALKDDDNDRKRKELVTDIQLRALTGASQQPKRGTGIVWGQR